jgi:flavodoxin
MTGLLLATIALAIVFLSPKRARADGEKRLTLYFSWSGNAKKIAGTAQKITGGETLEIVPADPYPKGYDECVEQAKKELQKKARPAVKTDPGALSGNSSITIVAPNWWGTLPMPVFSLLEKADLNGSSIYLDLTHGGGGTAKASKDMEAAVSGKGASLAVTFSVGSGGGGTLEKDLGKFLEKIAIKH